MGGFLSLITSLATGLYVICGFLLFWNLRVFYTARNELRVAQFGLERELAERRGGRALTMVLFMLEIIITIWAISSIASPAWSEGLPGPTQTARPTFITSTPAGGGSFDIQNTGPTEISIPATFAPPSTPQGTIGPRDPRGGCDTNTAWIEYPANGMYVFQVETILGTANIENFGKYRFEIRSLESSEFSLYPRDYDRPMVNGPLGELNPARLLPGEYRFRLVVFNTNNDVMARCEITIWITDPVPTATPIGAGQIEQ